MNFVRYVVASLALSLPASSYAASFYEYTFTGVGSGQRFAFDYDTATGQLFDVTGSYSAKFVVDVEPNDGTKGPYLGNGKDFFYSFGNVTQSFNVPYMTGINLTTNGLSAYIDYPSDLGVETNVFANFGSSVNQFADLQDSSFIGGNFSYSDARLYSALNITGKITGFSVRAVSAFEQTTPVFDGTEQIAAVPETSTWAMMLAGFGMIGFAARRRQSVKTTVRFA